MQPTIAIWKKIPFLRLLIALVVGILLQYYFSIQRHTLWTLAAIGITLYILYECLPLSKKFSWNKVGGMAISLVFIAIGGIVMHEKNLKNNSENITNITHGDAPVILVLQEPLVAKAKTYKAIAKAKSIFINNEWQPANGYVLLYFRKDSSCDNLQYGTTILLYKGLQQITNAGNPAEFDYQKYCARSNIYHQAFVTLKDYKQLNTTETIGLKKFMFSARAFVITLLSNNIKNAKALGVAQALLIGYRDNLDKDLLQAYSNAGVVHIIAISGLHLGLIYGLIFFLLKPLQRKRLGRFIKMCIVLLILWSFTFIAGAAPSILRSAVMFSFIAIGDSFNKKGNFYNNLSASAFVILIVNPFSLWDVGCQLSYTAVLSIMLFAKPIQRWFYIKNKILSIVWQLNSVTLAAQILTLPIVLYYFHQFPNFFLITNIIIVPFSSIVLYGELLLVALGKITYAGFALGWLVQYCIIGMNTFIEFVTKIPYALITSIHITNAQTIILYFAIIGIAWWLMLKKTSGLFLGLTSILLFFVFRSMDFINCYKQNTMIVYNIQKRTAIDLFQGRQAVCIVDSAWQNNDATTQLQPARMVHRVVVDSTSFIDKSLCFSFKNKNIIVLTSTLPRNYRAQKIKADIVIIASNPKIYASQLLCCFDCKQFVFTSDNSLWHIKKWQHDLDSAGAQNHAVSLQGAFVLQ